MSDIQFPRNQQSIADLATPAQSGPPAPAPEVPDISESSLLDVQAVFVSPRRVVDDGGVQEEQNEEDGVQAEEEPAVG